MKAWKKYVFNIIKLLNLISEYGSYFRESFEFGEIGEETEELHGNAWSNDQQAHSENNQTAELFAWTKNFVDEIF